jgi:hypothetical protein
LPKEKYPTVTPKKALALGTDSDDKVLEPVGIR